MSLKIKFLKAQGNQLLLFTKLHGDMWSRSPMKRVKLNRYFLYELYVLSLSKTHEYLIVHWGFGKVF